MKIQTKYGCVEGKYENHIYQFLGIPYGIAKRFLPPHSYQWTGVLDATHFQPKAPQTLPLDGQSEQECLNLNIYTPDVTKKLPVLVEIHGGAFQDGSNQKYHPENIIGSDQFVYVTINYRLGVLGYLYLGKLLGKNYQTSGNNGTLDQLLALQWIQDNIENFGGNPKRITLLGSSAGAKSVGALMSTKDASSLFSQVIMISGAAQSVRDEKTAHLVTEKFLVSANLQAEDLLTLPLNQLIDVQLQFTQGEGSTCTFGPVADDVVIASNYYGLMEKPKWKGRAIIGSSLHEMALIVSGCMTHIETINQSLFGNHAKYTKKGVCKWKDQIGEEAAWIKILSDGMYRLYSYRLAERLNKQGNEVYLYSNEFEPALHCMDYTLAFGTREEVMTFFSQEEDLNQALNLGKQIREAFIQFIVSGTPSIDEWLPLSLQSHQMIWNTTPSIRELTDYEAWDEMPDQVFYLTE